MRTVLAELCGNKIFPFQDTSFQRAERVRKNRQRISDEDVCRNLNSKGAAADTGMLTSEGAAADTGILALEGAAVDTKMVKQKN